MCRKLNFLEQIVKLVRKTGMLVDNAAVAENMREYLSILTRQMDKN